MNHPSAGLSLFTIITSGAVLRPCPTVSPSVPDAVYLTMLNPCVSDALTVDVISPSVLLTGSPSPASQHHATISSPELFMPALSLSLPIVNPSSSNDCMPLPADDVPSAFVRLLKRFLLGPRTLSFNKWFFADSRLFSHTRSGVNPTSRTGRRVPEPVYIVQPKPVGVWSAPASHPHAT